LYGWWPCVWGPQATAETAARRQEEKERARKKDQRRRAMKLGTKDAGRVDGSPSHTISGVATRDDRRSPVSSSVPSRVPEGAGVGAVGTPAPAREADPRGAPKPFGASSTTAAQRSGAGPSGRPRMSNLVSHARGVSRGRVWCGVVWRGVVWCGVVWRGVGGQP
jgi:hypothetical protein